MRVLSVTSEMFPLIKTGGLADVTGALPGALTSQGVTMHTLLPGYPAVLKAASSGAVLKSYDTLFGGPARLLQAKDLLILDAQHLYNRPGNPYLGPDGKDWPDSAARFAALSWVASDLARNALKGLKFDLVHVHDWQAALTAVYGRYLGGPKTILTVHNIAFQGQFPASIFSSLQLPPEAFGIGALEYYGNVSFLKGGIACADAVTTVSPTYAEEICTPEFGMGLDGVIRTRINDLHGIVNGIDTDIWNPSTDTFLNTRYSIGVLDARQKNKRALEKRMDLHEGDGIVHGIVSRLTWQKGLDVLASEIDGLVASGGRLAVVGTGESQIEQAISDATKRHPGRVGAVFGYDEELSHQVQAGADTMLVPSRFEPCGLTQLYGLRYGCVPVVARTGGLADTVIDANAAALASNVATGIQISSVTPHGLQTGFARATRLHAEPDIWQGIQRQGMAQDVSWTRSASLYANLYRSLLS